MTNVFHRNPHHPPPIAVDGKGICLIDAKGNKYIDASGGAAVSCLGHGDHEVIKAIKEQAESLAFAHTGFFSNQPAEKLANFLIEQAPSNFGKVYFVGSGSEAIEASLKLARQYHIENGEPERHKFIARRQSYHGNTLGALAVGGNQWRRKYFEPMLFDVSHISPCFAYREMTVSETEEEYGLRVANELEIEILKLGSGNVAAFVAETVVGATSGAVPPVPGYFKRVREICDEYGVLLILDEVMCGIGRTGTFFAFEQDDIAPDMVAVAKGLAGGYQAIGALLCTENIYDTIYKGSGFFQHGHTYMGHPVACAASLTVVQAIIERHLLENVREMGGYFERKLKATFGEHPYIGDIRGRGLFRGLEIVKDRKLKEPFDRNREVSVKIKNVALTNGLICYPMGGTIDGEKGDHILLAPPFIVKKEDIDSIIKILEVAINSLES